jgi:hypothetical protein
VNRPNVDGCAANSVSRSRFAICKDGLPAAPAGNALEGGVTIAKVRSAITIGSHKALLTTSMISARSVGRGCNAPRGTEHLCPLFAHPRAGNAPERRTNGTDTQSKPTNGTFRSGSLFDPTTPTKFNFQMQHRYIPPLNVDKTLGQPLQWDTADEHRASFRPRP